MKISVTYDGKTVEFRGDPNAADPVEDFLKYAQVSVVEEPEMPTWTFMGHWSGGRIVIEHAVQGDMDDERPDDGYHDEGLWAAAGTGPTREIAEASVRSEYEDDTPVWYGYGIGSGYEHELPDLSEYDAEELAEFALGMLAGTVDNNPAAFGSVRQTACVFCESDVEGIIGETEWRDRGGNTQCNKYERYDRDLQQKVWFTPPAEQKHIGRLP